MNQWTAIIAPGDEFDPLSKDDHGFAEFLYSLRGKNFEVDAVGVTCGVPYMVFQCQADSQQQAFDDLSNRIHKAGSKMFVPFVFQDTMIKR